MRDDNTIYQLLAGSTTVGTLLGVLPVLLAIPAAAYYLILIYEKISGKKLSELFRRKVK